MRILTKLLADLPHISEAKICRALERLKLLEKQQFPKLKWKMTKLGLELTQKPTFSYAALRRLVSEQVDEMDEPMITARQVFPQIKTCTNCKKILSNSLFGNSEKQEDGLTRWCLGCLLIHNRAQHHG
ncbi:MAG: formate dehydrogenase maturation protein FdhE [Candidatus Azotimanducaceae bacterium]|jgi:formate dehydrogenase maturation protein FdhE